MNMDDWSIWETLGTCDVCNQKKEDDFLIGILPDATESFVCFSCALSITKAIKYLEMEED